MLNTSTGLETAIFLRGAKFVVGFENCRSASEAATHFAQGEGDLSDAGNLLGAAADHLLPGKGTTGDNSDLLPAGKGKAKADSLASSFGRKA